MQAAASSHLAGLADALAVLSHGAGYPVQPSSNDPGEHLGSFYFGFVAVLALFQADLQWTRLVSAAVFKQSVQPNTATAASASDLNTEVN